MTKVDFCVIGGGIGGLSAAARLARHGSLLVVERESALGYHASGRSASFAHLGIGSDVVRALTSASRPFFAAAPGASGAATAEPRPAMFIARDCDLDAMAALERSMARFSDRIRRLGPQDIANRVPALRTGNGHFVAGLLDEGACKLDADAMLQAHARTVRAHGGRILTNTTLVGLGHRQGRWIVDTEGGSWSASILVNAAGAWGDEVAITAGVRPLGLCPLRRTIIAFDPPADLAVGQWPFTKTVADEGFYMLPEAGRLLVSGMDATPSEPVDAQPDEIDVATAAWRMEEGTTLKIERIAARWAGLRSFLPDGIPAVGFDASAPGFFWLAGQGGFGLQTSPALSLAAEALALGLDWPSSLRSVKVEAAHLTPTSARRCSGG